MKTEKLSMALEHYESLISDVLPSSEAREGLNIAKQAQQELSELQRLVDVVKGFIDNGEYTRSDIEDDLCKSLDDDGYVDAIPKLIKDIFNIVGYKE